ncbi:nucleoside diphosphate kinase regulator [Hyphomonas sp. NPDC076900]|uniref:nucleoside diphosphate kinase regulator n=1 Tax=unclassified Hyphomonas TaxID=2630699 RepID=UPI003D031714
MSKFKRPPVYVTDEELERLSDLAHAVQGREPAADTLIEELTRARIAPGENVPLDVVRMHDRVRFNYDGTLYDDFSLVYPNEANIAARRISVLTQVGAMLIGLRAGDTMAWRGVDGRSHELEVLSVMRE